MHTLSNAHKGLIAIVALAVIGFALLALPTTNVGAQTGQGKIEGQIVNGTKGATLSKSQEMTVTMLSVAAGATNMISATTKLDANGRFSFSNLDTISTTQYAVVMLYNDQTFFTDIFTFPPGQTTVPISLTVHETTLDTSILKVAQNHIIITLQPDSLDVTQVVVVQNDSDRIVVGPTITEPHRATLVFPVLPGATNFEFANPTDGGDTALMGNNVITYTQRFFPGEHEANNLVLHYFVPITPPTYAFTMTIPYDTPSVRLLIADAGESFQGSKFGPLSPFLSPNGDQYLQTTAVSITAGTVLTGALVNIPTNAQAAPATSNTPTASSPIPSSIKDNSQLIGAIVLGIAGIAAIGLLAYPFIRRRNAVLREIAQAEDEAETETASDVEPARVDPRRTILLQAIADLDDDFEAKKVSEEEYRVQRDALKARLMRMEEDV